MRRDRFYREASYTFENHQSRRVPTRNVDPVTTTISEASALRLATANASTGSLIARPQTPKSPATLANRCGLAATRRFEGCERERPRELGKRGNDVRDVLGLTDRDHEREAPSRERLDERSSKLPRLIRVVCDIEDDGRI